MAVSAQSKVSLNHAAESNVWTVYVLLDSCKETPEMKKKSSLFFANITCKCFPSHGGDAFFVEERGKPSETSMDAQRKHLALLTEVW